MKTQYKEFKNKIVSLLSEDDLNKKFLISEIEELSNSSDNTAFYSNVLELFVHLTFSEEEAKTHWDNIFKHYDSFKNILKRDVGLRVAMFDYFINLNKMLSNPILVEIRLFKEAEKLAMVDCLTGMFNRRYFDIALKKELKRAARFDKTLSLFLFDIDNFKAVNDTEGHLFGDKVLQKLSELIKSISREEDVICRYGGEEFIIILPESTSDGTLKYAERFRNKLKEEPFFTKNCITVSGGIATFPYDGNTVEQLIKQADKALYQAKYSGKDCIIKCKLENRRYSRIKNSWKFFYQPIEDTFKKSNIKEIITQDVSLGGVRFETEDKFDLDTKLLLNITLPNSDDLIIVGKVIWLKKLKDKLYAYGVQFFDINFDQIKKMKKVLSEDLKLPEE